MRCWVCGWGFKGVSKWVCEVLGIEIGVTDRTRAVSLLAAQVRHYLDARVYALKRIQTKSDSKTMQRITREVEMLSQMNHENVVRYAVTVHTNLIV